MRNEWWLKSAVLVKPALSMEPSFLKASQKTSIKPLLRAHAYKIRTPDSGRRIPSDTKDGTFIWDEWNKDGRLEKENWQDPKEEQTSP